MTTQTDRLRALALLLVAFIVGGAVGIAANRAFWRPREVLRVAEAHRERNMRTGGGPEVEQIPTPLEQLDLTPAEQQQLHAIARQWRPQAAQAIAQLRPVVSELENNMFAEMLCVISRDQQARYLDELRAQRADSAMIAKRFRLVNTHQCPAAGAGNPRAP